MQSVKVLFYAVMLLCSATALAADVKIKPLVLAETATGDIAAKISEVKAKLQKAGFEVAGEYSPYANSHVIIVTNDRLKQHAALSELGAYGAAQRVTISKAGEAVQVAFTNPVYMANAYRMKEDLADVRSALAGALGDKGEYGPDEGRTKEELREYHYKFMMPYFDDRLELASYPDYKTALAAVEKGLAAGKGGTKKVYRVDVSGKQESVFGVALAGPKDNECSGDKYIMDRIDFKQVKSIGHLPYELVVSAGNVYALYAEFRIAINFPDLSMVGSNSFASIMCAPSSIKTALTLAAGGKLE